MKPEIIVSSQDLERLEGLLHTPAARNRQDLDGLRAELERAEVREPRDMPSDVVTMNSRARIREMPNGKEYQLTLVYPGNTGADGQSVSVFTPAGSALLGLTVGQSIDWPTVDGHVVRLSVLEVTSQPEARGDFES